MKRKVSTLQAKANEANQLGEKIFEYESKITQMNGKIQNLQRQADIGEQMKQEQEALKRKLYQFNEATQRLAEYEQEI